jgi:hypothetical protein
LTNDKLYVSRQSIHFSSAQGRAESARQHSPG